MKIFDYLFTGKDIDKVPKQLKEIIGNKKPFWSKNLTGGDGEVILFKNQKTFILCFELNYIREVQTIVMNFENDQLHLTVITRSPPEVMLNTLFQIDYSSEIWFEKQFASLTNDLNIKFERII